jgi:hypothetical protein
MTHRIAIFAPARAMQTARRLVCAAVLMAALGAAASTQAQVIPALLPLPDAVASAHPDLARQRAALVEERNKLRARSQQHNAQCSAVEEGSAAEASCRAELAALNADLGAHIQKSKEYNSAARKAGAGSEQAPGPQR